MVGARPEPSSVEAMVPPVAIMRIRFMRARLPGESGGCLFSFEFFGRIIVKRIAAAEKQRGEKTGEIKDSIGRKYKPFPVEEFYAKIRREKGRSGMIGKSQKVTGLLPGNPVVLIKVCCSFCPHGITTENSYE